MTKARLGSRRSDKRAPASEKPPHIRTTAAKDDTEGTKTERALRAELARANERFRDHNRMRTAFLASISHELRTPLAIIRGATERMAKESVISASDERDRLHEIAARGIFRLSRIIENLIEVANINSGRFAVSRKAIDLIPLVRRIADAVAPLIERAGITIKLRLPENPILVEADGARMEQVLANLLDNAARFAAAKVGVRLEAKGKVVLLSVEDDGPGISEANLPRLFEPFSRLDEHGVKSHLGLGLAIVRTIVEAHDGKTWAENRGKPRSGARLIIALPRFS